MDRNQAKQRLQGCYTTIPTMFHDDDLELNLAAMQRHVRFLRAGGLQEGTGVLLSGGGAGDFSTLTVDERLRVAGAVIEAADGQIPVAVGAQTTSTRELVQLASAAPASVPPATDAALVAQIQTGLASLGFFRGPIDGKPGPETARAIREFENFYRYRMTGQVQPDLVELLLKAGATI